MSSVRPLRKAVILPDWLWHCLFISAVVGSAITGSVWFVIGLVILILAQGFYLFGLARCPICSGRFTAHRGRFLNSFTEMYRLHLECKQCHAIWDTGRIRDEISPNG